jgi:hypothetical protein
VQVSNLALNLSHSVSSSESKRDCFTGVKAHRFAKTPDKKGGFYISLIFY